MENEQSDHPEQPNDYIDENLQQEIDDALGGKSLEKIIEELEGAKPVPAEGKDSQIRGKISTGQIRTGKIIDVDPAGVLVELGRKDQGVVPLEQFESTPEIGARVDFKVIRFDPNEQLWILSRSGAVEHASWENLQEGQIVEVFVESINKGGLEVKFSGVKAFMPISQISLYHIDDPSDFVGKKIRCQVVEINRAEKRVIVSARAYMELQAQQQRERLLAELAEGQIREGIVRQVTSYGAFVDLGGVDGLVHVSQMSHFHIDDPADIVKPGQKVQVEVLRIDRDTNRISLGMKRFEPDPWEGVAERFPSESIHTGKVTKIVPFGAFIELAPGIEALAHISELSDRQIHSAEQVVKPGQFVRLRVLKVDENAKRIAVSLKGVMQEDEQPLTEQGQPAKPKKKRTRPLRGGLD
ncbi:MAG: 30S ribosomal protein S1 [Thermoplasmata archaeon]|nr:MAG: 30S ribosomal protein S1 [Thermoplasmata archaeon]